MRPRKSGVCRSSIRERANDCASDLPPLRPYPPGIPGTGTDRRPCLRGVPFVWLYTDSPLLALRIRHFREGRQLWKPGSICVPGNEVTD